MISVFSSENFVYGLNMPAQKLIYGQIESRFIMLSACFAQIIYASVASITCAHPWQKIRVITLTTIYFAVTDARPWLIHIFIELQLMLRVDAYTDFCHRAKIYLILGNSRRNGFCLYGRLGVSYDCSLDILVDGLDRFCLLCLRARSHSCCNSKFKLIIPITLFSQISTINVHQNRQRLNCKTKS